MMRLAKDSLAFLSCILAASAIPRVNAAEQSVRVALPADPIYSGTNITIGFPAQDPDNYPFSATFFCIQAPNGTEVVSCTQSPGYSAVANLRWTDRQWMIPTNAECVGDSSGSSATSFTFDSEDWPAGSYSLMMHRMLLFGSKGIEKNGTGNCIQPPYSNETLESVTYLNITAQPNPIGAATQAITTTLPFETLVARPSDAKDSSALGSISPQSLATMLSIATGSSMLWLYVV